MCKFTFWILHFRAPEVDLRFKTYQKIPFSTGDFLNDLKNACMLMVTKDPSNSMFLCNCINITPTQTAN